MKTSLLYLTLFAIIALSALTKVQTQESSDDAEALQNVQNDEPGFQVDDSSEIDRIEKEIADSSDQDATDISDESGQAQGVTANQPEEIATISEDETEVSYMTQCQYIELVMNSKNKKAILIETSDIFNYDRVLLTSTQLDNCDLVSEESCPANSFCQAYDKEDAASIDLGTAACTYDSLYMYPIAQSPGMKLDVEYKTTYSRDLECDGVVSQSGDNLQPAGDQTAQPEANQPEAAQDNDTATQPQHHVAKVIGLAILTLFILFLILVCVYRFQFRKNGEAPFNAPACCPGFIFPRQKDSVFAPIYVDRSHELTDYEPPVL